MLPAAWYGLRIPKDVEGLASASLVPWTIPVVVLAGFTLPKAYELKKAEVDKVVATIKAKVDELSGRLNE